MEIRASELRGDNEHVMVEVDCGTVDGKAMTIRYDASSKMYVLAEIISKKIHTSCSTLSELVAKTNPLFDWDDVAVDD